MVKFTKVSQTIQYLLLLTFLKPYHSTINKEITIFDDFCSEDILYKPYLKYYHGRQKALVGNGTPFRDHPPGFYNDFLSPEFTNTYLCINGLAWLYYKITTLISVVYEVPELHTFVHHCMIVNGHKGPDTVTVNRTLLGILLVGDRTDYRKPSLHQFTAPYQEPCDPATCTDPKPPINATSLMIIGDHTECILAKGRHNAQLRVRTPAPTRTPAVAPAVDDYSGTFCKLAYQSLDDNLESPTEDKGTAQGYLVHDESIKTTGCWLPDNYTKQTETIITKRKAIIDKLETDVAEFDMVKFFGTQLDADYHPATDPCSVPADCEATALEAAIQTAQTALDADPTNADLLKDLIKVKLKICTSEAFLGKEKLEASRKAAVDAWTAAETQVKLVSPEIDAMETAKKTLDDAQKAFDNNIDPAKTAGLQTDLDTAKTAFDAAVEKYKGESVKLTPLASKAESIRRTLEALIPVVNKLYKRLIKAFASAKAGGSPKCERPETPSLDASALITIKRGDSSSYLVAPDPADTDPKDLTKFEINDKKTCGELPKPIETCKAVKPDAERACRLLKSRLNRFVDEATPPVEVPWKPEDEWRKDVFEIIEDIFTTACSPMLRQDFAVGVNRIMRGYLTDFVKGTLAPDPAAPPATLPLPDRRPFWNQIMEALTECKKLGTKLLFKRAYQEEKEYFLFIKKFNNGTNPENQKVEQFVEQADDEFAFNWVIDRNWRMFATVMGICMPPYETKVPLISSKFLSHYLEDFIYPVAQEWVMSRDNPALRYIMGEYYGGKGDRWSSLCMEASYMESGDVRYRPLRKLKVNGGTVDNFFNSGPLAGTTGMYS